LIDSDVLIHSNWFIEAISMYVCPRNKWVSGGNMKRVLCNLNSNELATESKRKGNPKFQQYQFQFFSASKRKRAKKTQREQPIHFPPHWTIPKQRSLHRRTHQRKKPRKKTKSCPIHKPPNSTTPPSSDQPPLPPPLPRT